MSGYTFSRTPRVVPLLEKPHRSIKTCIPAAGTDAILERLDAVESRSMHGQLPIVWSVAKDYNVWDIAGNRFIDFTSGIFVANVGHGNDAVLSAVRKAEFLHSYTYPSLIRAEYLEKLTQWSGFDKAFLVSSGTEATETALRLMRLHGGTLGCRKIICVSGAFHGRTMGARSMSGSGTGDRDVYHMPFPTEHDFGIPVLSGVCGIMLETFQGWSARFYPQEFMRLVKMYCYSQNVLLCFDEMQAGFARTGKKFGFEHYGVKPDLVCVGKGMGGGVPVAGVLGSRSIMDTPGAGDMSSTHSANPLACAAGLAVLQEIERLDLVKEAERKGAILFAELQKVKALFGNRILINGRGLIAALIFHNSPQSIEAVSRVVERCMETGLLVLHTGRESIKIGPPLTIPDSALVDGVSVLCDAICDVDQEEKWLSS